MVIREPTAGRPVTWTGPGFMRVSEGDSLEFYVDDIATSMEYDIVIRYEPQVEYNHVVPVNTTRRNKGRQCSSIVAI